MPGQAVADTAGATGGLTDDCIGRAVTTEGGAQAGETQSDSVPYCTTDTDGDGVTDSGPAAPPPTHDEIVAAVCPVVSRPAVGANPREYGITGMATWLWDAAQSSAVSASGSIRGYAVACSVTPAEWVFDTADPSAERYGHQRTYSSAAAGEESADTAVQHVFETKGTYTLTLSVTWERVTSAGADQPTASVTRDYQVKEVRTGATTPDR